MCRLLGLVAETAAHHRDEPECDAREHSEQGNSEHAAPAIGRARQNVEIGYIDGLAGAVAFIGSGCAGAAVKAIVVAVAGEPALQADLVADLYVVDQIAQVAVVGDQAVIGNAGLIKLASGRIVAGAKKASELPILEVERIQIQIGCVAPPNDAQVCDIQVIVPQSMQHAIAIVVLIRNHQAVQSVIVERLNLVTDVFEMHREGFVAGSDLNRLAA